MNKIKLLKKVKQIVSNIINYISYSRIIKLIRRLTTRWITLRDGSNQILKLDIKKIEIYNIDLEEGSIAIQYVRGSMKFTGDKYKHLLKYL